MQDPSSFPQRKQVSFIFSLPLIIIILYRFNLTYQTRSFQKTGPRDLSCVLG